MEKDISKHDFVFYSDRLIRLVVEHGLGHLPFTEKQVVTPTVEELEKIAVVNLAKGRAIISLIGNVQHSSLILERAFHVLWTKGINVQMISQRASKVNISLIVNGAEAEGCVEALHKSFFKSGDLSELLIQPRLGNGSPVRTMQVEN